MTGAAAVAFTAAHAQAQNDPGTEASGPIERIVVTTQKREQEAFDVPLTLSAFSSTTLERLGITAFDELSDFTPGLTVQLQSPNTPSFVIRGITSDSGNFQDAPRVSVYYNGVDVSRSRGSAFEMYDLERVEIARGPQATLFGTAASIGAVSVITARPEQEFGASGYFGGGNDGYQIYGGHITGGGDLLQGRLAMQYRRRNGYVRNTAGDVGSNSFGDQDDLNGLETFAIRPSLRFTPNSNFTGDVIVSYERNTPPGTAFLSGVIAPTNGSTSPFSAGELGGVRGNQYLNFTGLGPGGPQLGLLDPSVPRAFLGDDELGLDREVFDINVQGTWDINEAFSLTGIVGWREFDSLEIFDADGSQVPLVEISEDTEGDQTSVEFRINYDNGGRFRGFLGVSYFQEDGYQRVPFVLDETLFGACAAISPTGIGIGPNCVNPDGSFNRVNIDPATAAIAPLIRASQGFGVYYPAEFVNTGEYSTYSVFADATFDVTSNLEVTAGVRFIQEERESGLSTNFPDSFLLLSQSLVNPMAPGTIFQPLLPGFSNTQGAVISASDEFDAVLPRFNVLWRITDDMNLYGTVAQGRRSPVISITQTSGATSTNPLAPNFCNPLQLTDDPACEQIFLPNDVVLPNVTLTPEETVWNYEIGGRGLFFDGRLLLEAAVFYQEYEDFIVQVVDIGAGGINNVSTGRATNTGVELEGQFSPTDDLTIFGSYAFIDAAIDNDPANGIFAGNRFRLQPEHSGSLAVDYRRPVFGEIEGFLTLTQTYRSDVFFEPENAPIAGLAISEGDVYLTNLRIGLDQPADGWRLTVFANNLFDEEYIIDAGNTGGDFGTPTFIPGPPLLWGVELRGEF